jgi:hypothetical protein
MQVRRTGVDEYTRTIKALIAGPPGSGKTRISSTFPDPIFASAEGGLMSIADRNIPFIEVKHTDDLLALKQLLETDHETQQQVLGFVPKTVVVDTIDEVARLFIRERLEADKKDAMAIADWGWLGDQLRGLIRALRGLNMHVVMTVHLKSTEDSESGRVFYKPAIQGAVGDEIAGYVDLALLLDARTTTKIVDGVTQRVAERRLMSTPDPTYPWIKDRSGQLPPQFPVDLTTDFERLNALIYGHLQDLEPSEAVGRVPVLTEEPVPAAPSKAPAPMDGETELPLAATSAADLASMTQAEKLATPGPWECESCKTLLTSADQRDFSVMKSQDASVLCPQCLTHK